MQENKKNLKSRKKSLEMLDAELSKKKALICSSIDDFKVNSIIYKLLIFYSFYYFFLFYFLLLKIFSKILI